MCICSLHPFEILLKSTSTITYQVHTNCKFWTTRVRRSISMSGCQQIRKQPKRELTTTYYYYEYYYYTYYNHRRQIMINRAYKGSSDGQCTYCSSCCCCTLFEYSIQLISTKTLEA